MIFNLDMEVEDLLVRRILSNIYSNLKQGGIVELAELVGKRWRILKQLFQRRSYVTELADELGKKTPDMSNYLKELEEANLVESREEASPERGMRKYFELTDKGRSIVNFFWTLEYPSGGQPKFGPLQVDLCLEVLSDSELSDELRGSAATQLYMFCSNDPVLVFQNKAIQELFEEIVRNPPQDDKGVGERLRAAVSTSFMRLLTEEKTGKWALTKLYPTLMKYAERGKNEIVRRWAVSMVGGVARGSSDLEKRIEAKNKLLEIYFADDVELNTDLGNAIEAALSQLDYDSKRTLLSYLKPRAKDQDPKTRAKAEGLLKDIIHSSPRLH